MLATLLALLVLLRGLSGLLEPDTTDLVQTAYGALVVFVAAAVGGATGAWQAAAAGASTRRAIVVVGAAATALGCVTASVVLAVAESVEAGRALVELVAIVTGASSGAWAFPRAVLAAASLRGDRGQSVVEYVGIVLVAALIVAALLAGLPRLAGPLSEAVESVTGGGGPPGQVQARTPSGLGTPMRPIGDLAADGDGDELSTEEESALGTSPEALDSDRDGVPDGEEYARGTDPRQGVEPLTEDNMLKAWERVGISEKDWRALEDAVLDEVNPGVQGFLSGAAADGLTLDENGELTLIPVGALTRVEDGKLKIAELQENGVGGGLAKGLGKLLGGGARAFGPALGSALRSVPAVLRGRLARVGIGPAPRAALRLPQDAAVSPGAPPLLATIAYDRPRVSQSGAAG